MYEQNYNPFGVHTRSWNEETAVVVVVVESTVEHVFEIVLGPVRNSRRIVRQHHQTRQDVRHGQHGELVQN